MAFDSSEKHKSNFKRFITESKENRLEELSNEYSGSDEYSEFCDNYNDIFRQIKQALPADSKRLADVFDELHSSFLVGYQKYFYDNGFTDCKMLFNLLRDGG